MSERCAVVTGGAQNIGGAIAERLRDDGYRVVVLDVIEPEAESFRADARRVDLSDRAAAEKAFAEIAAKYPVRVLVNNVGIVAPASFDDVDVGDFDRIMHLNARTALLAAKAFVPTMRRLGGGRIVMNTSRVTLGKIDRTLYSASKGALQSMARTWALELAGDGITVNCVAPGPIATTAFWRNNPRRFGLYAQPYRLHSPEAHGDAGRRRQRRQLLLQRRRKLRHGPDALRLRRGDSRLSWRWRRGDAALLRAGAD